MGPESVQDIAVRDLQNAETPPERLAQIAAQFPESHPGIAAHPNVYPELLQWIAEVQAAHAVHSTEPQLLDSQALNPHLAYLAQQEYAAEPPQIPTNPGAIDATPQEANHEGDSAEDQAAPLPKRAKLRFLLSGIGIGLAIGGALSAVLLIWVLPGLFGGFLG